jgi:hypothetical protein
LDNGEQLSGGTGFPMGAKTASQSRNARAVY